MLPAKKLSASDTGNPQLRLSSSCEFLEFVAKNGILLIALDIRGTILAVPREGNLSRSLSGLVASALLDEIDRIVPGMVLSRYRHEMCVRDWTMVTLLECCDLLRSRGAKIDAAVIERAFQSLVDEYRVHSVPLVDDMRLASTIRELRLHRVHTVAAADGPQAREEATLRTQLPETFRALVEVFSSETAGVNKLSTVYFERLLERYRILPSQLLIIGDRADKDMAAAKALGAHGILVREFPREGYRWTSSLNELLLGSSSLVAKGVVLGRFQPFHVEHLRYVQAAARRATQLQVGITCPYGLEVREPGNTRTSEEANPLPFWLRQGIISEALAAAGLSGCCEIIPMPLSPNALRASLSPHATIFTTAVEPWSYIKERIIRESGFTVERLNVGDKTISSTVIRELIRNRDKRWRSFMPAGITESLLSEIELHVRCCGREDRP